MKGYLKGNFVLVPKTPISLRLASKLIGEIVENKVVFNLYEALYLLERGKLEIVHDGKTLTKDDLIRIGVKRDERFLEKYIVYKDLKSRGYIVGAGLKFGSDFRVYEKGANLSDRRTHSKWVVWVFRQGEKLPLEFLASVIRVAHSTRKKVLIAVVDIEGDVTYYEFDWVRL